MTGYEKMESYITENVAPEKIIKETTSARMSAAAARRRFCHLNLLDRQFNPEAPNKAWVSDITELH